jgi:hypothetical protein
MTVDEESVLSQQKDLVARFLGLTSDGRVFLRLAKDKLTTTEQVALYLVGKIYANVAGYSESVDASNDELGRELGMPGGSVRRVTMELRKAGVIATTERGSQRVILNALPAILNRIGERIGKSETT